MFSIRNPRCRLKTFKPPQVLTCSLLCLFAVSAVFLIAQLRAIELEPNWRNANLKQRTVIQSGATNDAKESQPLPTLTTSAPPALDNATERPLANSSIDRDDRAELATPEDDRPLLSSQENSDLRSLLDVVAADEAASSSSPVVAEDKSGPESGQPPNDANQAGLAQPLTDLPVQDELLQQAAAQMVSSFNQGQELVLPPSQVNAAAAAPSLAELTAAGTAAGLLMHDLIAQANMAVEQQPQHPSRLSNGGDMAMAGDSSNDEEQEEARQLSPQQEQLLQAQQMQQLQQLQQLQQQPQPQSQSGEEDENDDADAQLAYENSQTYPERADWNDNFIAPIQDRQLNGEQTAAQQDVETDPGELLSVNQMPDSIESLMGADMPSNMDEPEEATQDEQSSAVPEHNPEQQQLAGTNLMALNNNNFRGPVPAQMHGQQQVVATNDYGAGDDDSDGEDGADEEPQGGGVYGMPLQGLSTRSFRAEPILVGPNGLTRRVGASARSDLNIVNPMRDSIDDLNAAAGHYYKKKKKKVKKVKKKKIIIKKKKKVKKYKVVKYKKKKKKKKVKKHHHKKHHHDHGHYYMYAKVPKKKAWEFGFKKGNKKHWISRHEKGYKNKFKTKVKWYDKKSKGKGYHIWDYNHHDKKKKHY